MSESSAHAEPVGSIADEAFKLLRAMASQQASGETDHDTHQCTTTWCPVCQVVGLVRDNPEALDRVTDSAAQLVRSLRDLADAALRQRDES